MKPFDLTTSRVVRLLGIVGLIYEIFVDHLRNPTALVVFGGLAEGPDLFSYWNREKTAEQTDKTLPRQLELERKDDEP